MNRRDTIRLVYHQRALNEFDARKPRTAAQLERALQSDMPSMHSSGPALLSLFDTCGTHFLHTTHRTWCTSCETPLDETIRWHKITPAIALDAELLESCCGDVFRALDSRLHVPERAGTHASLVCAKCNVRGQFVRRLTTDMEKHVSAPRLIMVELPDDPPQRLGGSYDVRAGESVSAACGHVAVHLSHLVTTLRFLFVAASPYDRRPTSGKI